ncbi:hypothetical protein K8I61_18565 [bacterium]|nr:hypothetical protein [bacterium]
MDALTAWWSALGALDKVLWCVAVPFSVLALLQTALEIFGGGDGSDFDAGHDAGGHDLVGLHLFSVKGFIFFFCALGWVGLALTSAGVPGVVAIPAGMFAGFLCMVFFAWIFATLHKLSETGNYSIENALLKPGTVYLRIPARRAGRGKVNVTFQGAAREIEAVTDGEEIPTGASIEVVQVLEDGAVLVTKQ